MKSSLFALILFVVSSASAQTQDSTIINKDSVFVKVEVEAYFPGGEQNWNLYVQKAIERDIDRLFKDKKSYGTCEMQFIVDKDGTLSNIEALTLKNSLLAKILTKAIKNGPKWIPAIDKGKPVKAWRRQKVTLKPPESN